MCNYWEKLLINNKKAFIILYLHQIRVSLMRCVENEHSFQRMVAKALTFSAVQYCTISGP